MVKLTCAVSADDLPVNLLWVHSTSNMTYFLSNITENSISLNITIVPTSDVDYGNYTCMASNRFGNGIETITLHEAGKKTLVVLVKLGYFIVYYFTPNAQV